MNANTYHWCVFKNDPTKSAILDDHQYKCILQGDHIGSGLDLDTYMSLKDEDWPIS